MASIKTTAALVLLALCLPAFAADDAEAARTVLAALYARMNAAMSGRNTAELGALLAPDFHSEDVAGKAKSATQVAELKDDPGRKLEITFGAVTVDGGGARTVRHMRITT